MQRHTAVTAYLKSEQLLLFAFAWDVLLYMEHMQWVEFQLFICYIVLVYRSMTDKLKIDNLKNSCVFV